MYVDVFVCVIVSVCAWVCRACLRRTSTCGERVAEVRAMRLEPSFVVLKEEQHQKWCCMMPMFLILLLLGVNAWDGFDEPPLAETQIAELKAIISQLQEELSACRKGRSVLGLPSVATCHMHSAQIVSPPVHSAPRHGERTHPQPTHCVHVQ